MSSACNKCPGFLIPLLLLVLMDCNIALAQSNDQETRGFSYIGVSSPPRHIKTLASLELGDGNTLFSWKLISSRSEIYCFSKRTGDMYRLDKGNLKLIGTAPKTKEGMTTFRFNADVDLNGNFYVIDIVEQLIHVLSPSWETISVSPCILNGGEIDSMNIEEEGTLLLSNSIHRAEAIRIDAKGNVLNQFGDKMSARYFCISLSTKNCVITVRRNDLRLIKYSKEGEFLAEYSLPYTFPEGWAPKVPPGFSKENYYPLKPVVMDAIMVSPNMIAILLAPIVNHDELGHQNSLLFINTDTGKEMYRMRNIRKAPSLHFTSIAFSNGLFRVISDVWQNKRISTCIEEF